mmetsp:Transcript_33841/g.67048  ORF Transcript_33841/g.67048 Transcript_33841/m.67048 type:complete len:90 (-) Transcript_33841:728-997(-)
MENPRWHYTSFPPPPPPFSLIPALLFSYSSALTHSARFCLSLPSQLKRRYLRDIFQGRASRKGRGCPMAYSNPKTPPSPPVFPAVRSAT